MNKSILIPILTFFLAITAFGQSRRIIRVNAETTVDGDIVRLVDIAQIDADTDKAARLKTISLGYAPGIGSVRELKIEQIRLAVSAAGFSESDVELETPARILIRRAGQIIDGDQFRMPIEKHLADKFAADKIEAKILKIELPENIQVPKGALEIRPNFAVVRNFFQTFALPVEIRVDGRVFRRFSANVEVEAFVDVLVAAKDLTVNQKLSETDVRIEKRRIIKPLTSYLRETARLRGVVLVKNIAGGTEITLDSFVSGVVVKAGDPVRVEAQSGRLKIMINGEARASGKIGDRIAVKNLQSGSILQAVVIDEGLVRILF